MQQKQYTKTAPFKASVINVSRLTHEESSKDICHVALDISGSGITYKPGDIVGVWFKNSPSVVDALIELTQNNAQATVCVSDKSMSLYNALLERVELTQTYPGFVSKYLALCELPDLANLAADKAQLRDYLMSRQIIDVMRDYPSNISPQDLVDILRPLTPRSYSIASSQKKFPHQVHMTVAHVNYFAHDYQHQGGASGFLCDRLKSGDSVDIFFETSLNFQLPEEHLPIIMVGPGTGVAPFRAFMQERAHTGASGENWLFFGNPNQALDYLYQTDWEEQLDSGLLTKLSLAFSRDQEHKVYVQHLLLEQGKLIFEWLQKGAHFYVCGDANKMAKDVESALIEIIKVHGGKDERDAKREVLLMRKEKRYQKDVY